MDLSILFQFTSPSKQHLYIVPDKSLKAMALKLCQVYIGVTAILWNCSQLESEQEYSGFMPIYRNIKLDLFVLLITNNSVLICSDFQITQIANCSKFKSFKWLYFHN